MQDELKVENKGLSKSKLPTEYTQKELDAMAPEDAKKIRDAAGQLIADEANEARRRWLEDHLPPKGDVEVVIATVLSDDKEVFLGYGLTVPTNRPTKLSLEERDQAQAFVRQSGKQFRYIELPADWKAWK